MNDPLPPDVVARLTQEFGSRADEVAAMLLAAREIDGGRRMNDCLVRCIVYAARGDEAQAGAGLLELGLQDYRDLIVAGEYDSARRRIRDFRVSFLIDSPEKLWIGGVACVMFARGYVLASLDSQPATTGPFRYATGFDEGIATFAGPIGKIEIEKRGRQWIIHGNPRELEVHEMNHAFDDERGFRDALSCYLLSVPKYRERRMGRESNSN